VKFFVYKEKSFSLKFLCGMICAMFIQDIFNQQILDPIIKKQITMTCIFVLTDYIINKTYNINNFYGMMYCLLGLLYYDMFISPFLNLHKDIDYPLSILFMILVLQTTKHFVNKTPYNLKEILVNVIAFSTYTQI
jgi:hypothetical protein